MERERRIDRDEADRLLAGREQVPGRDADLADAIEQIRRAGGHTPSASLEDRHLAAMAQTFDEIGGYDPAHAHGSDDGRSGTMLARLIRPVAVKVAIGAISVLITGSALAATGNLGPAQDPVANTLAPLVDLPGGADGGDADDAEVDDEDEANVHDEEADADEDAVDDRDEADDADDDQDDADDDQDDADDDGDEDADEDADDAQDEVEAEDDADAQDEVDDQDDDDAEEDDDAEDEDRPESSDGEDDDGSSGGSTDE